MMLKSRLAVFVGGLLLSLPVASQAASVTLQLDYQGSFKSDYVTAAGYSLNNPLLPGQVDPGDVHQFSVLFTVDGLASDQALQYLALDVQLGSGLSPDNGGGTYQAYYGDFSASYDPPGPAGPAPLYSTNQDGGTPHDLKRLTSITSKTAALALKPGEGSAFRMGDFYLTFDGLTSASLSVGNAAGDFWLYWDVDEPLGINAGTSIAPANFAINVVPEPGSIGLLAMAALAMLRLRRRGGSSLS